MISLCRRVAASRRFQDAILAVIVANAVLIGLETSAALWERHGALFHALNLSVQVVFAVEIAVRVLAHAPRVDRFFRDGWNVFDFAIVGLSLLPVAGPFATVARLARLLRALRIVSALPELRLIVATMLRSIPSLANVIVLLGLILYVYAVVGLHLFGGVDPAHWGSVPRAGLTLFEILTLEGRGARRASRRARRRGGPGRRDPRAPGRCRGGAARAGGPLAGGDGQVGTSTPDGPAALEPPSEPSSPATRAGPSCFRRAALRGSLAPRSRTPPRCGT
jgi:hypothetical protein